MSKIDKYSTQEQDLKTGRSSRVSFAPASVGPESSVRLHPIINQEDVTNWYFDRFFPFIIENMQFYDQEKDNAEEYYQSEELKPEVVEFLATKDNASLDASSARLSNNKFSKKSISSIKPSKKSVASSNSFKEASHSSILLKTAPTSNLTLETDETVKIEFTSGGIYIGYLKKKLMNQCGKYFYNDGTIYEGDFKDGYPTGQGEITFPNLDYYKGGFLRGLFHGEGTLNIKGTDMVYQGSWKQGKKHGKGWLIYAPNNWYNGDWYKDMRHGNGERYYPTKDKYRGEWRNNERHGDGIMIWANNDIYKGQWENGIMQGNGEYVWNSNFNRSLSFPILTGYIGQWVNGKRHGKGTIHFGTDCGARYTGDWVDNFKDGAGVVICGNGKIVQRDPLFKNDKPVVPPSENSEDLTNQMPIFTVSEAVDAGYYIDKFLMTVGHFSIETCNQLREFEQLCIRNVLVEFLPKLTKLYQEYACIALGNIPKNIPTFKPVMVRMFLWMFYRDIELTKLGISLVKTDQVLMEHPGTCLEELHGPFEKIYFWQFVLSLIGVSLELKLMEEDVDFSVPDGACSIIFKKFLTETVFKEPKAQLPENYVIRYYNLVPIGSVYEFYKSIGEPHTARKFLNECCVSKNKKIISCLYEDDEEKEYKIVHGQNAVPVMRSVFFIAERVEKIEDPKLKHLIDFRCLGPRNIMKCIYKVCPEIMREGVICNMEYPIVFIEFYEILLHCIFLYLELKLKHDKWKLIQEQESEKAKTSVTKSEKSQSSRQRLGSRTMSSLRTVRSAGARSSFRKQSSKNIV